MKIVNGWHLPDFDTKIAKQACKLTHPHTDYQQEVFDAAMKWVRGWDMAIDVGANIGLHSVRLCQQFLKVEVFEPSSANFECLAANTAMYNNIVLHQLALGQQAGELCLELDSASNNCGAFSFKDFQNTDQPKHQETVLVQRLDEFDLKPNLIKIDTQGFESEVLRGAEQTLAQHRPVIIAEVGKKKFVDALLEIIGPFGYSMMYATNKDKVFAAT